MNSILAPTAVGIDGNLFGVALRSGIHRVILEQDNLNKINVFPVADGDTGTNLSLSLSSSLGILANTSSSQLDKLLVSVADALLDGARGNSGAIMAQFFQGVSDAAESLTEFTSESFARAVTTGSTYAHDAIAEPQQGTILSVISAFATALHAEATKSADQKLVVIIESALAVANAALDKTREQLDVLRKAGVVDAGAKGFVVMIEGMSEFLSHGHETEKPDIADLLASASADQTAGVEADLEFRFCTECMINGVDIDRRKLREALSGIGNSLVIAGSKAKAKVHVHVDDPGDVYEIAQSFGVVSAQKADDMLQQQHSSHQSRSKFAVITDSAADISDEEIEQLDIHVVPLRIQFGDRGYLDKIGISPTQFFEMQRTSPQPPTTSQPAPGDFRRQFQFLASHYPEVIAVSLTGTVSGTLQAAEAAAERLTSSGKVRVIDSLNASNGQGLVAVYAAECAQAGMDADSTIKALQDIRRHTRSFAFVDDLSFAVRGGRVPGYVKKIADFLKVTPVLVSTADGRIKAGGIVAGRRDPLPGFARFVARRMPGQEPMRVSIGHALCEQKARRLKDLLQQAIPEIRHTTICELGSALGVHAGAGALVVGLQPDRPPKRL